MSYSSNPAFMQPCRDCFILASTELNQSSTLPLAFKFFPSATRSPSPENMAWMSTDEGSSPKSSFTKLSKHLRMWGWTACGFFDWLRISSNSSADKK